MVPSGNNVNPDGSPSPNLAWMLLPGTELPPVPDDTAMAGPIISTRNMQARFVKEIAPHAAVAISFENNTVGWGGDRGTGLTLPTTVSAPGLPKPVVSPANFVTPATGGLGNAYVSLGTMPDIVGKIGFDPTTRLHLEAWGVLRQFKDAPGLATDLPDAGKLYSGGGVVGFFVKIIPGKLDLQAAGGYGALGSALNNFLPDVTYDSTGKPAAIYERALGLNLIPHPHRNVDIYLMAGVEKAQQAGINGGATAANAYGYGNPGAFNGASCETLSTLTGSCAQDTQTVWNVMAEVSWRMFNSPKWGHFDAMPQVQYGRRILFRGADGIAPSTTDWATELCFRYWPW
jgi:hypothetical protein